MPASTITPRPGVTIKRDSWGVPHVYGDTRADVMYGSGYAQAEDRLGLMELFRGPGRIAALDAPGVNPFTLATQQRIFSPALATDVRLGAEVTALQKSGAAGNRILTDIDNYIVGINDYRHSINFTASPDWVQGDVIAAAALLAGVFGKGGGDETRRSMLLDALQTRLGDTQGRALWEDLREQNDPEAVATITHRPFKYGNKVVDSPGNAVVDDGTFQPIDVSGNLAAPTSAATAPASSPAQPKASNAVLVGAQRSQNGHPLAVMGPQVGYLYPELLTEMDLHGPGIDVRGVSFPGSAPYVEIGRGADYSWSATSSGSDIVDQYVEKLCGNDKTYEYKGKCRSMDTFTAGNLLGPTQTVKFYETVHGPVIGYGEVDGVRVAITQKRSTHLRDVVSALGFEQLNTGYVNSASRFKSAVSKIELTFNWFYADNKDIAMFSSGKIPRRNSKLDTGLPIVGTGKWDPKSYLSVGQHPFAINPPSGELVNWNNKPAKGFGSADDEWGYGSIYRQQLLDHGLDATEPGGGKHDLASVASAMNKAATEDLRVMEVLPSIATVLDSGGSPTPRAAEALQRLKDWRAAGGSRLDVDLDGKIDDPGAAIMDEAWPKLADAVMSGALDTELRRPRQHHQARRVAGRSQRLVLRDGLVRLPRQGPATRRRGSVQGAFNTHFCGNGSLSQCRDDLWAALDAAVGQGETDQGTTDQSQWHSNATPERIGFGASIPYTMRWANRPTFQQAMSYSGHR